MKNVVNAIEGEKSLVKRKVEIAEKLEALVKEASLGMRDKKKWSKKVSFAPSKIGNYAGSCGRYWFYAFRGVEFVNKTKPQYVEAAEAGITAHERMTKRLDSAGVLKVDELEVTYADPPIRGFVDNIIVIDDVELPIEYKSIKDGKYQKIKAKNRALKHHGLQLLIYMHILGYDLGYVIYESNETHERIYIPVTMNGRSEKFLAETFEWMRTIFKAAEEDRMPNRPFTKSSYQCKFCDLKNTCWKDEREPDFKMEPLEVIDL